MATAGPGRRRGESAIALVLGGASIATLVEGVDSGDAEAFVIWIGVGALLGGGALVLASRVITGATHTWHPLARVGVAVLVFGSGLGLAAVAVFAFVDAGATIYLAPAGLAIAMVGLLFLSRDLGERAIRAAGLLVVVGLVATAAPLVPAVAGRPTTGGWTGLLLLWVAGLTVTKVGLTPWMTAPHSDDPAVAARRTAFVLRASLFGAVVAMLLVVFVSFSWALLAGGWLLVLALSTGGLAATAVDLGRRRLATLAVVGGLGVVALGIGGWGLLTLVPDWQILGLIATAFGATIGAFFVLRGEGVVALVLFGALLAWALVDRVEEPRRPPDPSGTVLVLGDSFMAGQGAESYREHTNSRADGANMCRRSPGSFAYLVAERFNRQVADYACNGAETHQVRATRRSGDATDLDAPDGDTQLWDATVAPWAVDDLAAVDLVLLSVGGNDAEFATVVTSCFLPTNCEDEGRSFLTLAEATKNDLAGTYAAIQGIFSDHDPPTDPPPIVVVPYPSYVGAATCGRAVDETELAFANVFIQTLNATIRSTTEEAGEGVHYFDAIDHAYAGRTLCDDEPAANFVDLLPPEGPILDRLTPTRWHEGSAHPNETGHACTAVVLTDWIVDKGLLPSDDVTGTAPDCPIDDEALATSRTAVDALIAEVDVERGGTDWRSPIPGAEVCRGRCDDADAAAGAARHVCVAEECLGVDDWARDRALDFFSRLIWPLAAAAIGGLLLAVVLAHVAAAILSPPARERLLVIPEVGPAEPTGKGSSGGDAG